MYLSLEREKCDLEIDFTTYENSVLNLWPAGISALTAAQNAYSISSKFWGHMVCLFQPIYICNCSRKIWFLFFNISHTVSSPNEQHTQIFTFLNG